MDAFIRWIEGLTSSRVLLGLVGGLVITALNMIGALAVLGVRKVSDRFMDT